VWFAASHKKVDGPHLQIHQITFLLLRVGSILFFVRSCKHSGLQQCCTKFFSLVGLVRVGAGCAMVAWRGAPLLVQLIYGEEY
jgi:hypothetical protein